MHSILKFIFWAPKRFRVHDKLIWLVIFVTLALLDKIFQNHDSGKTILLSFPKSFGLLCQWLDPKVMFLDYACKNGKIFFNIALNKVDFFGAISFS